MDSTQISGRIKKMVPTYCWHLSCRN